MTVSKFAVLMLAVSCASVVQAKTKPCEELRKEIETKIQSAGVTSYTLEIVTDGEVKDPNMVVGRCEGGTRKIVYQRNDD